MEIMKQHFRWNSNKISPQHTPFTLQ